MSHLARGDHDEFDCISSSGLCNRLPSPTHHSHSSTSSPESQPPLPPPPAAAAAPPAAAPPAAAATSHSLSHTSATSSSAASQQAPSVPPQQLAAHVNTATVHQSQLATALTAVVRVQRWWGERRGVSPRVLSQDIVNPPPPAISSTRTVRIKRQRCPRIILLRRPQHVGRLERQLGQRRHELQLKHTRPAAARAARRLRRLRLRPQQRAAVAVPACVHGCM
jgi:hypothetical protein